MKALVIEDEATLREQLAAGLREQGYAVDTASDGEEGLYLAREYSPDIAIIDLGLPGLSGMEVIRQLRATGARLPILVLTARGRWQDKVEGLEAGADDYLVKPFEREELLARLRALLRRSGGWSRSQLRCAALALDPATQRVTVAGQAVELTAFEYRLLHYLMLHAGKVISKTELTEHIYEQDFDRDSNTIEVFIGRLRRKLDPDGDLQPIETVRGRGYRLALERDT
ncbi:MAG TPA: response regulator transcription factor [Thiohalobacter sp.]|nr:response regulator transcription factor [Thiohalobacter sp.]